MGRAALTGHPAWCARGHRCGLGEHRSEPHAVDVPGARAVITRVRDRHGRQHAEVRLRLVLDDAEPDARRQLEQLLRDLPPVLERARARRSLARSGFVR